MNKQNKYSWKITAKGTNKSYYSSFPVDSQDKALQTAKESAIDYFNSESAITILVLDKNHHIISQTDSKVFQYETAKKHRSFPWLYLFVFFEIMYTLL
jgi:hypothetical protein